MFPIQAQLAQIFPVVGSDDDYHIFIQAFFLEKVYHFLDIIIGIPDAAVVLIHKIFYIF